MKPPSPASGVSPSFASLPSVTFALAAIALIVAVCGVYANAVDSPFIFDDTGSVFDNPSIARLWPLVGDPLHPGPLHPPKDLPTSGRPLVNLSLALNYHFAQLDPRGYHIFNLAVHVLSALLLMAIVRRTLCLDYFAGQLTRASLPLAFAVALLWALHPLQTETVVYVTQRTELMVGFFYLATLYAGLRYWQAASTAARGAWLIVATLACLAGAASKEVIVTAPVVVLLFERTFIRGSFRRAIERSWPLYVCLCLSWALLLGLNYSAPRSDTAGFHLGVSAYDWWLTQTKVLLLYLKLTVWPWPLSIHYQMPYLTTVSAAWPWLAPVALLALATLLLLWRRSAVGFVAAWVLLILSPTLVVPIVTEVAAERRMYLPLAALVALAVIGACWLVRRTVRPAPVEQETSSSLQWADAWVAGIALLLAMCLGVITVNRLWLYHNPIDLWQDTAEKAPTSWMVHDNLANAFFEAGRLQAAIAQYQQALQLNPDYALSHNNLGNALVKIGHLPEAIEHFEQALRLKPGYAKAHYNLGNAYKQTGRFLEAVEQYQEALAQNPNYVKAHNNLGNALKQLGRFPESIEQYQLALEIQPNYTEAWINLATAYRQTNRSAEAVAAAQKALDLARAQGQSALAQRVEAWLNSYHAEEPATSDTSPASDDSPIAPR